jgi:hypothetical protein
MDECIDFMRFQNGVLESPLPERMLPGEAYPQAVPSRRSARARLATPEAVLDFVVANAGTGLLGPSELASLGEAANGGAVARRLRRLVAEERRYLDRRLLNLFDEGTRPFLLVPFLLVALHHRAIAEMVSFEGELLDKLLDAIALRTVVQREQRAAAGSGTRPALTDLEAAIHQLAIDVRRGRNDLVDMLGAIVDNTAGFPATYQAFCNERIRRLVTLREEWKRRDVLSVAFSNPPSSAELTAYERLGVVEVMRDGIPEKRTNLRGQLTDLAQSLRGAAREDRPHIQSDLRDVRQALARLNTMAAELNAERRQLRLRLRSRMAVIRAYIDARERGRDSRTERDSRDTFLRSFDRRLATYTDLRLYSTDDTETWAVYRSLLRNLILGDPRNNIAIELLVDAYFREYATANSNRDMGFYDSWGGSTYPGHPENALDMTTAAGNRVYAMAPARLRLPLRLREGDDSLLGTFALDRTEVVASQTLATTDVQDAFAKISYGLLRRRGQQRAASGDIADIMTDTGDTDLAPEFLADPAERNFDVTRILAGLIFGNLTESPAGPTVNMIRDGILDDVEAEVRRELGLAPRAVVFRPTPRGGDRGQAGVGRLIAHRPIGEVFTAVSTILGRSEHCGHDPRYRDGLCHRLWRLLWTLHHCGAEFHRRGQAATLDHHYRATSPSIQTPAVRVQTRYSHLHALAPALLGSGAAVRVGDPLGEVGLTGNAVSSHIHLEISVYRGQDAVGSILAHEFFPLVPSYLAEVARPTGSTP